MTNDQNGNQLTEKFEPVIQIEAIIGGTEGGQHARGHQEPTVIGFQRDDNQRRHQDTDHHRQTADPGNRGDVHLPMTRSVDYSPSSCCPAQTRATTPW